MVASFKPDVVETEPTKADDSAVKTSGANTPIESPISGSKYGNSNGEKFDDRAAVPMLLFDLPAANNNWFGRDTSVPVSSRQAAAESVTATARETPLVFSSKNDTLESPKKSPKPIKVAVLEPRKLNPKPTRAAMSFDQTSNQGKQPDTPLLSFSQETQLPGATPKTLPPALGTGFTLPGLSLPTQITVLEAGKSDIKVEDPGNLLVASTEDSKEDDRSEGHEKDERDSLYDTDSDVELMATMVHAQLDNIGSENNPAVSESSESEAKDPSSAPASPSGLSNASDDQDSAAAASANPVIIPTRRTIPLRVRRVAGGELTVPLPPIFTHAPHTSDGAHQTTVHASSPNSGDKVQDEVSKSDFPEALAAPVVRPIKTPAKPSFLSSLLSEVRTPDNSRPGSATVPAKSPAVEKQLVEQEKLAAREADLKKRAEDLAERQKKWKEQVANAEADLLQRQKAQDAKEKALSDAEKALKAREEELNKHNSAMAEEIEHLRESERELTGNIALLKMMIKQVVDKQSAEKKSSDDIEKQLKTREDTISKQKLALEDESRLLKEREQAVAAKAESLAKEAAKLATKASEKATDEDMVAAQKKEYKYLSFDALQSGALVLRSDTQSSSDNQALRTGITSEITSILRDSRELPETKANSHAVQPTDLLLFRAQIAKTNSATGHDAKGTMQLILSTFSNEILGNSLFANHTTWMDINLVDCLHDQVLHAPDLDVLHSLENRAEQYFNSLREGKVPLCSEEFMEYVKQCGEYAKTLQELRWVIGEGSPAKKALTSFLMSVCKDLSVTIQHAAVRMGFAE